MIRLVPVLAVTALLAACAGMAPHPPMAAGMGYASLEPECRAATPGNSAPGFRCTGDYTGDASGKGR